MQNFVSHETLTTVFSIIFDLTYISVYRRHAENVSELL